jgi:hypothetical protein
MARTHGDGGAGEDGGAWEGEETEPGEERMRNRTTKPVRMQADG